ncbi:SMI1/KNR4 family protein [Streptomyces sp. NPDC047002]|uniref:SMI1/KNR4 family protein n=1 Tax=Streptomyces sp. NPDC047002 TaxID=3155475 RepID=UPI003456D9F4
MGTAWREMIGGFPGARPGPPAGEAALAALAEAVGGPLPPSLHALLRESDGVVGPFGHAVVWPAAGIGESAGAGSDLLFFGDNGKGDRFGLPRGSDRTDVWLQEHTTDARKWVAPGLWPFLRRALRGDRLDWYVDDLGSVFLR